MIRFLNKKGGRVYMTYWEDVTVYPTSDNKPNRYIGLGDYYKIEMWKYSNGNWYMRVEEMGIAKDLCCKEVKEARERAENNVGLLSAIDTLRFLTKSFTKLYDKNEYMIDSETAKLMNDKIDVTIKIILELEEAKNQK